MSVWVKRGSVSSEGVIFAAGTSQREFIRFETNGQLTYRRAAGTTFQLTTSRKFLDSNAWYHIVIAVDTSQSTDTNKYKLYVNGELITSLSTAVYMNNNYLTKIGGGQLHTIGKDSEQSAYFDGYMSHFHFCDGTQLAPTVFGSTDATTGEWKINTSPSFTPGTNGFTILKNGNTITDQSANSNDFSLGGGTLTKSEDCPSNIFNTFNFNDNYYENGGFSNGNTTFQTTNSNYSRNTSNLGMTSGKFYWEVKPIATNSQSDYFPHIGITASQITGTQDFVGKASTDYAYGTNNDGTGNKKWNNDTGTAYGSNYAINDIVGVALDLDNLKIYFSKNGTWQESGDPTSGSTGTGAAYTVTAPISTALGAYFPSVSNYDGTGNVTFAANFGNGYFGTTAVASAGTNASGNGIFEYDVPAGYTALCTKGLNA
jgi:hypothetical protein